jgi:enterochelin esterase-like enzyme
MLWRNFTRSNRRCNLLIFLDGQNLFETNHSGNNPHWSAERQFNKCSEPLLVVAVPASARRYPEYVGWSHEPGHYSPAGDSHADFLVNGVLPYLLTLYPNARVRALVGASAGGVASLYTGWLYPGVFPGVGCLSAGRHYFEELLEMFDGTPAPKVYLSCGNRGMDAAFQEPNRELARALRARGGCEVKLRLHQGDHSEPVWSRRLPDLLNFFL